MPRDAARGEIAQHALGRRQVGEDELAEAILDLVGLEGGYHLVLSNRDGIEHGALEEHVRERALGMLAQCDAVLERHGAVDAARHLGEDLLVDQVVQELDPARAIRRRAELRIGIEIGPDVIAYPQHPIVHAQDERGVGKELARVQHAIDPETWLREACRRGSGMGGRGGR